MRRKVERFVWRFWTIADLPALRNKFGIYDFVQIFVLAYFGDVSIIGVRKSVQTNRKGIQ
jgi:hypothetical protein